VKPLMQVVEIDGDSIVTWQSFHTVFAKKFGFPNFYGNNMNAWIDCMTYLDDSDAGMSEIHVESGNTVTIQILNPKKLRDKAPEIWEALNECSAFVNWRRVSRGDSPVLSLSYYI